MQIPSQFQRPAKLYVHVGFKETQKNDNYVQKVLLQLNI